MRNFHFNRRGPGVASTVGIGLASAIAGAAIAYFLYGTETGSKKREHVEEWVHEKKRKITKGAGELSDVGKEIYSDMSSLLREKYGDLKDLNSAELSELADEVRARWQQTRDNIEEIIDDMAKDES